MNSPSQLLTPIRILLVCCAVIASSLFLAIWLKADKPENLKLNISANDPATASGITTRTFHVKAVKFAPRRALHFLSATTNFRSDSNTPVAIREADFANFQKAGIEDLATRYQGKTIHAQGKELQDEGQKLLLVSSPEQIEIVDYLPDAVAGKTLSVVNESGKVTKFEIPLPDEFARITVEVEHESHKETYTGVPLTALLAKSETILGAELRGTLLSRCVIVISQDGYYASLSLSEVDPYFTEQMVMLAETRDGKPLPPVEGPLQLVITGDKHRRRWVGQVERVEVKPLAPSIVEENR